MQQKKVLARAVLLTTIRRSFVSYGDGDTDASTRGQDELTMSRLTIVLWLFPVLRCRFFISYCALCSLYDSIAIIVNDNDNHLYNFLLRGIEIRCVEIFHNSIISLVC